jgi:hypothetical protein
MKWKSGKYVIDQDHSSIGFSVVNFLVFNVKGDFKRFKGEVLMGDDFTQSKVNASIDVTSINTDWEGRDEHLMNEDFFHAKQFPEISFMSKSLIGTPDRFTITGMLQIHGITHEIRLPCKMADPMTVQAETSINRKDFGLTAGPSIKNEVKIFINIKLIAA